MKFPNPGSLINEYGPKQSEYGSETISEYGSETMS